MNPTSVKIIDPAACGQWDERLLASPGASFFLSAKWASVLRSTYAYRPYYLTIMDNDRFQFLWPFMAVESFITGRRAISLPFSDCCEPICQDESGFASVKYQLDEIARINRWNSIELRGGEPCLNRFKVSRSYIGHELDLHTDLEKQFQALHSTTRRNIRKAEREGVRVAFAEAAEDMQTFFGLHCMTRKKHQLPPQPFSFFRNVYDTIIAAKSGLLLIAYSDHRPIAAAIFFLFGNQMIYKYGASDQKYQSLHANHLLMWKAIEYGCANGFQRLDFGKTEPANEGLRRFKLSWGAKERVINYRKYLLNDQNFIHERPKEYHWTNQIFARTPLPLLRIIGRLLYSHAA